MRLYKRGSLYILECQPWENEVPREHGMKFNSLAKGRWATKDHITAVRLLRYAERELAPDLERIRTKLNYSVANSRSTDGPEFAAPDGYDYMPFQRGGINYSINHPLQNKGSLIADEMGLGKTIQAIGIINERQPHSVLVVCPASLKANWANELSKWLVHTYDIQIPSPKQPLDIGRRSITIINYEQIRSLKDRLMKFNFGMVVVDESQYIKNPKSQRGAAFRGTKKRPQVINGDYRVALTGTPMPNRIEEIYNVINWIMPGTWGTLWNFQQRYCEIEQSEYGRKILGGKNLDDLAQRLRALLMVRRLKKDVLKDLPPKRRTVLEIPSDGLEGKIQDEIVSYDKWDQLRTQLENERHEENTHRHRERIAALRDEISVAFSQLARMRLEVARAKLPMVKELIRDSIESGQKMLVFAHHAEIIDALVEEFKHCAVSITGRTKQEFRQPIVEQFQNLDEIRLAVLSFKAAGVGLTLTKAGQVDFAEMMWVPDDLSQAEDRAHRHGQTASVLVRHLVLENSLDARMAKRCVEKQQLAERVLDV